MMSTIAPSRQSAYHGFTPTKVAGSKGDVPAPEPQPAPAPPQPADIDFTNIDTPSKAALLPVLDATAFVTALQTFSVASDKGLVLDSTLSMDIGASQKADLKFSMSDPSTAPTLRNASSGISRGTARAVAHLRFLEGPGMQVQGTMGNAAFKENWTVADGCLSIDGSVGNSLEALKLTVAEDGTHLDGTVGNLAIHELIADQGAPGNDKLVWDGTIGDQKIHQELGVGEGAVRVPARSPSDIPRVLGRRGPSAHVEGTLGDAPISMDAYASYATSDALAIVAQGNIAGTALSYTHDLKLSEPAPTPEPTPEPTPDPNYGPGHPCLCSAKERAVSRPSP